MPDGPDQQAVLQVARGDGGSIVTSLFPPQPGIQRQTALDLMSAGMTLETTVFENRQDPCAEELRWLIKPGTFLGTTPKKGRSQNQQPSSASHPDENDQSPRRPPADFGQIISSIASHRAAKTHLVFIQTPSKMPDMDITPDRIIEDERK
jgi:hypothetical protein